MALTSCWRAVVAAEPAKPGDDTQDLAKQARNPIATANWEADRSKDIWTVPVGGGAGRLFRIGKLPVNVSVRAFDYVEKPEFGADWELRAQVQFLFPK